MFFLFMLQGAIVGKSAREHEYRHWHAGMLLLCVALWYGILYFWGKGPAHIVSLVPLFGVTYFLFSVSSSPFFRKLYDLPVLGGLLFIAGSLCLEVYLVQSFIFTTALNAWFPLNIPIVMALVFVVAYALHCGVELFSQTFGGKNYVWGKLFLRKEPPKPRE